MKTIKAKDMSKWIGEMIEKASRDNDEGRKLFEKTHYTVSPNSAFIRIIISYIYYDEDGKRQTKSIRDNGAERFEKIVTEIKKAIAIFTTDLNVIDSYFDHYGYIILNISDNIQVTE